MTVFQQQDDRAGAGLTAAIGGHRGLWALSVAVALAACDSPARVKPWRHAPDPVEEAAREPRSPALAHDETGEVIRGRRAHTLRVHVDAEPRSLNPMIAPSVWTRRISLGTVYETLVRYQPPEGGAGAGPGRYTPGLARSWRISPSGTEIILELQPGVTFHDGRTMTSVDVQFSLDTARDGRREADHVRPYLADVEAVELITSRSLRIRLVRPNGWVLRALAEVPIIPYHLHAESIAAGGRIVGTGPWQLASWKDDVVHLTRYGRYWGPAPAISDIELVYQPDAARTLTDAKRGELDLVPSLIPAHFPEQASAPGIASSFAPLALRPPSFRYLAFDCAAAPTDDVRVRHAISLLVDRQALASTGYDGLARPVGGPVWPGGPGDGASPPAPRLDPAAAGRLLDDAGWRDGDGDGFREQGGQKLRLDVVMVESADLPPGKKLDGVRDQLLAPLRRAGVLLDVRTGSDAVVMNRLRAGDFDLALLEWSGTVDGDLAPLLETGGAWNLGRCSSREIDRALEDLRGVWEPGSRVAATATLAAAVADSWPIAAVVAAEPQGLVHRRVGGVVVWDGWIDLRALTLEPSL
jgi:peptide/nickel transport system substrate-binding protein